MHYPNFVEARINAPVGMRSMCHICPLNGQRKVGHDGPVDAEFIGIFEAPGEGEEDDRATKGVRYGRPLQGKTGYFMRVRHLAPVGLQELLPNPRSPGSPRLGALYIHLMNVVMCRPPLNKIESTDGKKAQRCCANGARGHLNMLLATNPNRTLTPAGGTALSMLRGVKTPIEPFRGRVMMTNGLPFPYEPESDIEKYVLRGMKPKEEWWSTFEVWLKSFVKLWRSTKKTLERVYVNGKKEEFLSKNPWLTDWTKLYKKQLTARRKREKAEVCIPT